MLTFRLRAALFCGALALVIVPAFAKAADTINIGVNEPLTGAVAASGNYVTNGAKLAAEEINAKGGVLGKNIELIIEDNKSNPTDAVAAAEKLIVQNKVPVMMGAWSSTYTLAVMSKLMQYKVPMVVETSSSDKITTSGNPYIFRTAATNGMEARAFSKLVGKFHIKKADFLVVNNDWGLGAAKAFSTMLKSHGVKISVEETMDASAQDLSAQLSKIKSSGADTLFVTTEVEQITLILKQAKSLGLKQRIITTGGSSSPSQLIEQAGTAANGSYHILFFAPWFPEKMKYPKIAEAFVANWKKHGYNFAGLTEGFRGHDGIETIVAAIKIAGKAEPAAIVKALWKVHIKGVNGDIKFIKEGPKGKQSGQVVPQIYVVEIKNGKVTLPKL